LRSVGINRVLPFEVADLGDLPAALYEMIAQKYGAVVLDGKLGMTGSIENAKWHCAGDEFHEHGVKDADADALAVAFEPEIEYATEELTVGSGLGAVGGQHVLGWVVRFFFPFDGGDELQPACAKCQQVLKYLVGVMDVEVIEYAQEVELNVAALQMLQALEHIFARWLVVIINTIVVVELGRPVDGQANEEAVFVQKPAPFFVQQGPVGLDGVLDGLARPAMAFLQFDGLFEEFQASQRRLATLPGDGHFVAELRKKPSEHVLEGTHGHFMFVAVIDGLGRQVIAIGAIKIAQCPNGLDHDRGTTGLQYFQRHGIWQAIVGQWLLF